MSGKGKKSPIYEDSPPSPRRANIHEDDPPPSEEEIKSEAASQKAMADLGVTKVKLANVSGSTIGEVEKMAELSDFAYADSDYKTPEIESTLKKTRI